MGRRKSTAALVPCSNACGRSYEPFKGRKTTLCYPCSLSANGRNPKKNEKNRAAMLRRLADPAIRAETLRIAQEGRRRKLAEDPEFRARWQEMGRALGKSNAMHNKHPKGSPARMKAAATRTETMLGWCPHEYRDEYRRLIHSKRLRAADARAVIEAQIKDDAQKQRARAAKAQRLSFDEQIARIREGKASVVAKFTPSMDTGPYTLGGVASGMI